MCEKLRRAWRKALEDAPREPTEADRRLMRAMTYVLAFLIFVALPFVLVVGAYNTDPASTDAWERIAIASIIPLAGGMFILTWSVALRSSFDPPLGGPAHLDPVERGKICIFGVIALILLPMVVVWGAYGSDITDAPMWEWIGATLFIPVTNVMGLSACYLEIKGASKPSRGVSE